VTKHKKPIERLAEKLQAVFPKAVISIDPPLKSGGVWFLDIELPGRSLSIQWRPRIGFGITSSDCEIEFGQHPQEVLRDLEKATQRCIEVLRGGPIKHEFPESLTLAELRELLLLSQQDLADRLGVSQAALSSLEKNFERSKIDTLKNLAEALGAELELRIVIPGRGPVTLKAA